MKSNCSGPRAWNDNSMSSSHQDVLQTELRGGGTPGPVSVTSGRKARTFPRQRNKERSQDKQMGHVSRTCSAPPQAALVVAASCPNRKECFASRRGSNKGGTVWCPPRLHSSHTWKQDVDDVRGSLPVRPALFRIHTDHQYQSLASARVKQRAWRVRSLKPTIENFIAEAWRSRFAAPYGRGLVVANVSRREGTHGRRQQKSVQAGKPSTRAV